MKPKFGIIGCGGISRFHLNGLAKLGAEIVHVADINASAAQSCAERFGAQASTDYRTLLADPAVTVVSVLTSGKFHKEICLAALEAGKDVICEKTMANDADEAEQIVRAVATSGRLFFTAYMKRYFPAVRQAKALLSSLGTIFSVHVRSYQPWGNLYDEPYPTGVANMLPLYGGAILKMAGSHVIDLTQYLVGRPHSVFAFIDYIPGTEVDRRATGIWRYPGGMTVCFEAAGHPLSKIGYERNAWDERLEINGVNGRLELYIVKWDEPEKNAALLVHYDNRTQISSEYRFDAVNPFDLEMAEFHACLERRERGHSNEITGFQVDAIIAAMEQSSRKLAAVTVDWRGHLQ